MYYLSNFLFCVCLFVRPICVVPPVCLSVLWCGSVRRPNDSTSFVLPGQGWISSGKSCALLTSFFYLLPKPWQLVFVCFWGNFLTLCVILKPSVSLLSQAEHVLSPATHAGLEWGLLNIHWDHREYWFSKFIDEIFQIKLMFVRCLHSSAAVIRPQYEHDFRKVSSVLIILKKSSAKKLRKLV